MGGIKEFSMKKERKYTCRKNGNTKNNNYTFVHEVEFDFFF